MLNVSLEIARGLAALWVFIYHIRLGIDPGPLRSFANGGFLGVPLFFVISGYCMMASSRGVIAKGLPASAFLKRRLRRIFPPFWASILVVMAAPFVGSLVWAMRSHVYHWPNPAWQQYTWLDWMALWTLTKGLATQGAAHKPWAAVNAVYWSLAIEVQFYLVMYVALVFRRRFEAILVAVTAGSLLFWALAGTVAPGLFPEYWPMFALGLLLYTVLKADWRPARLFAQRTVLMCALASVALAVPVMAVVMYVPSESLGRQTLFAVACAFLFWLASGLEKAVPQDALPSRAFLGLGKMSYSVYLLHIHVVSLVTGLVKLAVPRGMYSPFLYIAATLPFTYLFYQYCEKRYAMAPRAAGK
jgi:peptidoglycan/LPS O-acetylase OafA/YrhL